MSDPHEGDHLARTRQALVGLHREDGDAGRAEVTFRTWVPRSERKQRQRLFVESSTGGVPRYVAKVPLDPEDGMVEREWRVLTTAGGLETVRPRAVRQLGRGFVMTYVPSRDFPDVMRESPPSAWPGLLSDALELAASLHLRQPRAAGVTPAAVAATYLPGLKGISAATLARLDKAAIGPTHGDLGPWNLRVDEHHRIAVIDWEDHRSVGLPDLDVLNVVLTAALIAYPAYREHGFDWLYDRVFHERNDFRRAADRALDRYALLTGRDVDDMVALTPVFCRYMIHRIRSQSRPTDHLFYGSFAARFDAEQPTWSGVGDE